MKGLVISSNMSGAGKTTVTLGLMKTLKNRGFDVQGYKVGPDYIDTAFHSKVTGKPSRNLDIYLMGEEGVKAAFSRGSGNVAIVEGVMGLYDGKGISSNCSTAHVSKVLDLPIVLVLSPKSQVATLCAEIEGLKNFGEVNIVGVILNNISESYYKLLKVAIESNCKIDVLGYVPKNKELNLDSRHLGLVQSSEVDDLDGKIQLCSSLLEKNVDIDKLISCLKETKKYEDKFHFENKGIRIGVARDKAFSFYYKENLEALEELGEVVYFSPLKDNKLPNGLDFLYLGGGYPEVFADELSKNKELLKDIKDKLNNGLRCYAECGGLMYLTETIEGKEMVGFFKGNAFLSNKLQNFGYNEVTVECENKLLTKGLKFNCHEFHHSYVDLSEPTIYEISKTLYDNTVKIHKCGYIKKNTVASYGHIHFFNNIEMVNQIFSFKNKLV